MKKIKLGNTNIFLPAIGQGTMGIGGELIADYQNDKEFVDSLKYGYDCGMTFVDTAEVYGQGHSEELIGKSVIGIRDKIFIASKFSPENSDYRKLIKAAESTLLKLKTDFIDLYQIHWPNPSIPIEDTVLALEKLLKDGKIKYIGVSNFSINEINNAKKHLKDNSILSLQVEYNLNDRSIEENLIPFTKKNNITTIGYSPLAKTFYEKDSDIFLLLVKLSEKYNKSISQIILNWIVMRNNILAIPKSVKKEHLLENSTASDFKLIDSDYDLISKISFKKIYEIEINKIFVSSEGYGNKKVYQTLDEAIQNNLKLSPSPLELAESILLGEEIKSITLIKNTNNKSGYEYNLVEGRLRYWAWVIAFKSTKPIKAYVT